MEKKSMKKIGVASVGTSSEECAKIVEAVSQSGFIGRNTAYMFTDADIKNLRKSLYPKDCSKKFTRG